MRGSLKQRSKGSWTIILDLGYEPDADGVLKRKQKYQTIRGTKKQAEAKLGELLHAVRSCEYVDPSTMTVGQWLPDWLEGAKSTIRPASYTRYHGIIENHMLKAPLAGIPLQKLTESHIEAYYGSIPVGSRPLHHTVLRRALRKAKKQKLLASNPAGDLDHVPQRPKRQHDDARVNCWTAAEASRFLVVAKAAGSQAAALYATALDSGARKNELCGLRWEDVDFDAGRIRIARQLTKPGPEPTFGPPKNGFSREIALSAETIDLLRQHKRAQAELKMKNRKTYCDHSLVFAKEYGDLTNRRDQIGLPLQSNNLGERHFDPLITAADVKRITFHGMRHYVSFLTMSGDI